MKLLDRYILAELAVPFLFGVGAFTGILTASTVLFELVSLMVSHGLALTLVLEILALRLPEMVFYTFPMSMLLATLLAFGRLSGDGEITALKAAGVSLYRIMAPVLAIAVAVSALTIALDETVVPAASWQAQNLLYEALHQRRMPVSRDHVFYHEMQGDALKRLFYARHFDGRHMDDVVVQEFENNKLVRIVQAKQAVPADHGWTFRRGTIYQIDDSGQIRYTVGFDSQRIVLGQALLALGRENRTPIEMDARELAEHIRQLASTGATGSDLNALKVQLYQKFAVPFASLVFALVGAPMGLRPQRTSGSLGLGLSVLVIFVYYILMFVGMALGQTGALSPLVGAWLPDAIAGAIGAGLVMRLARS